ncbi:MAG TPA: glycosyltransferase family 4 protein [Chthoniobacterales bacterium]|nr:glycosyltransferase family 4 protein [Chthoniobacterales bacterium]
MGRTIVLTACKVKRSEKLNVGFVRRGFSPSGGAEAYLLRVAGALVAAGHEATLFTTEDWPEKKWALGRIIRIRADDPIGFADELERSDPPKHCDLMISLERIWRCDFFRAGDGVHQAWLDRRAQFLNPLQRIGRRFNKKHDVILRLEKALLGEGGARRVIANSAMVADEIMRYYDFPGDAINVIPNGVRVSELGPAPLKHARARAQLKIGTDEIAALFLGSGWERKGLRFAIAAIEKARVRLLVAGRGNQRKYRSGNVTFLGEMEDVRLPLAAADLFILPTIYDPFSNASLEAMAAGLPVITTRANGCSEIVEPKVHGTIVERADDIEGLSQALRFWSDGSRRLTARPALLERATQFDLSRNVAHTLEVLLHSRDSAELTSG